MYFLYIDIHESLSSLICIVYMVINSPYDPILPLRIRNNMTLSSKPQWQAQRK